MRNSLRTLSAGVHLVATDDTWIEGKAIQQLQSTARLPGMHCVVGMPDLHPGRGYPVGAVFFSHGRLYPALVGNDIGCGMALWRTSLDAARPQLDKLQKRLGSLEGPLDPSWAERIAAYALDPCGHERSLGTIGGGNHFAELQQIDQVYADDAPAALGLDRRELLLLVHSGSRGFGEAILRNHVEQFNHDGLADGSSAAASYLAAHAQALRFAAANRELIALRMLERLRSAGSAVIDVHHNLVAPRRIDGVDGWLHRKGATPSDEGYVVIPGSRGDYSYLVKPLPDATTLHSLAHGAGRKWLRGECKERLAARYSPAQLARTALGSRVVCDDRQLLYEEAPEAYKPIASIIDSLQQAGLIEPVARLKPVLTYKTHAAGCT